MNSWLNELPVLHPSGKGNKAVLNPDDATALFIATGDTVRASSAVGEIELTALVSDRVRAGVVVIDHGWGSRVFDPRGRTQPNPLGSNGTCSSAATSIPCRRRPHSTRRTCG